jgi:hypothetical protein
MRRLPRWLAWHGAAAVAGVLTVGVAGMAPAAAATGPVSATPEPGTPQLATTTTTEQVRQLADCGGIMYAVGTFTSISQGATTVTRNNVFSFSDTAPYTVTSWNPDVNGTVNTIAFSPSCSDAYIGGKFTQVGSTAVKNIAEIDTTTGAVVGTFKSNASGQIETIVAAKGHLLIGGSFKGSMAAAPTPTTSA